MKLIQFGLLVLGFAIGSGAASEPTQAIDRYRESIEASLIEMYEGEREQSSVVETIEFLDRDGSKQPIRILHTDQLAATNRILVIALDDGVRSLYGGFDDVVMIGLPFADRVKDLVPPVPDDAAEGSPEWSQAQITTPDSDALVTFLKEQLVGYAEDRFGPFYHRVLFGYSLGGIFTIQALMTEPEVFDSFIAGSPSLWYRFDYYSGITLKAAREPERFRNRCLVMSSGEDEPSINAGARRYQRLLDGLELPLITHYQRNAEIDHGHNRTISFIYGWEKIFNTDDIFPPAEAIEAGSLEEFKRFLTQWLGANSCVADSLSRNAPAYVTFAAKLVEAKNWSEMHAMYEYISGELPASSRSFSALFSTLVSGFKEYPDEEKLVWARRYEEFMASEPAPGLAIHMINRDIVEYLAGL